MALDIFTKELGDTNVIWPSDAESQALLGIKVLDAVQMIVDVLADQGVQYKASFAVADTAYTDHTNRVITLTAKPMIEGGRPLDEIARILTGFAVHEVGHTKERELEFSKAVRAEWPGKVTPHRLANILSDVRLEATTIARFAGLHDVFVDTMNWVAEATCPSGKISYGKTLHDRLNFVGQAVRYAPFVTFGQDPETQSQLRWWQDWGSVDADTDNEAMLRKVRDGIDHIRDGAEYEPEPPVQEPPPGPDGQPGPQGEGEPQPGKGESKGNPTAGNPDDDFRETEDAKPDDDDTEGEANGESDDDTEGESDGDGDGDGESGKSDGDGNPTEGGSDNGGESTEGEPNGGQLAEGETLDRTETSEANEHGAGGSGKAIASNDNVDEGLDEDKLAKTQDQITEGGWSEQRTGDYLQQQIDTERRSVRIDAGRHGTMKVKVTL